MRGILRSALLFYTGGSVQIWMLAIAATSLAANLVLAAVLPSALHPFVVLLNVVAIVIGAMGLFLGAVNFRAAAAARVLRFIPQARMRLGLGVLLAEIILAVLAGLYVEIAHITPATPFPTTVSQTLSLINLLVLWTFLISGPNPWIRWSMGGLVLLGVAVLMLAGPHPVEIPGISEQTLLVLIAAVSTLLFGTWYLRASSIDAPDLEDGVLFHLSALGNSSTEPGARTAINLHLLGQGSVLRASWPNFALYGCALVVVYFTMTKVGLLRHPEVASGALMTMALYLVGTSSAGLPSRISRRARPLWLSGLSREESFAQVERVSLQCLGLTAVPLLAVIVLAWSPLHSEAGRYLFLLTLSTSLCNTYLAIMNVQSDSSPLNYPLIAFVALTLGVLAHATPTLLIPVLEIVALPILRHIASQRWRQIDWMICKPIRRGRALPA